jgi:hypothetical protein
MELHDLTEELPGAYERIEEVARKAVLKHREWAEAKEALENAKSR